MEYEKKIGDSSAILEIWMICSARAIKCIDGYSVWESGCIYKTDSSQSTTDNRVTVWVESGHTYKEKILSL